MMTILLQNEMFYVEQHHIGTMILADGSKYEVVQTVLSPVIIYHHTAIWNSTEKRFDYWLNRTTEGK